MNDTAPTKHQTPEYRQRSSDRLVSTFLPEPEPRKIFSPFISADDHVIEQEDLFRLRAPAKLRERVPHLEFEQDVPYWVLGGVMYPFLALEAPVGRPSAEWDVTPQKFEEFRIGTWDPTARLRDMDLIGMWGSVLFPSTIWGFAGRRLNALDDQEVGRFAIRTYNDYLREQWVSVAPDRYVASQLTWFMDPAIAAEEIRRNAALGFRAVSFIENPEFLGLPSIHTLHWDPFFQACEETETVINLHVGSSSVVHQPSSDSPMDVRVALLPVNGILAVVDWVFSRIAVRFPRLKIVMSEAGVSWVPMIVERLNRAWRQIDSSEAWSRSDPHPVDVLLRNFFFTSIEDPSAMRALDIIGESNVMVECDYPHGDSSWPDTQDLIRDQMKDLPPSTVAKLCFENAADVYRMPLPPRQLFEQSEVFGAAEVNQGAAR